MTKIRVAALGLLVSAGWLTGCGGGSVYVTRFPRWEYRHYDRIAVVPARPADPRASRQAELLADRLTTLLTQGGQFTVLSRAEMQEVFAEQDLSKLADAVDEGTALPVGKLEVAQALVVPKITDYKLIADQQQRTIPRYAYDKRGRRLLDRAGRPVVVGEETIYSYTHGAEVGASVRVVDAATGKILVSHSPPPVTAKKTSANRPPSLSPEDLAAEAVQELSVEFYKTIAPTKVKVKLKTDMLVLAIDYFDGRYDTVKKLSRAWADFLLVVRDLPEGCDRNHFRVAIAEEDGRRNLFEEEFVWSGTTGPEGVSYRVPLAPLGESGADKFVAKLYSVGDPEPKLERKFSLEQVKGD